MFIFGSGQPIFLITFLQTTSSLVHILINPDTFLLHFPETSDTGLKFLTWVGYGMKAADVKPLVTWEHDFLIGGSAEDTADKGTWKR